MTSEIRTNSLKSRAGLSTVTMTDSGPMFSGITTFVDNSGFTFGVGGGTSIFTPATNVLTFGTNNTEKVRIDANGNANITGVTTAANFKTGVSNLHDVGLTLSGGQIDVGSNIKIGTAGVVTATSFVGDGSNLTGLTPSAITSIGSDGAARVLTSDGDGTATAHSFVTIESNRLSINRGSGTGAFPLIVRRTDASGIIAEFANSSGYGLLIGQNSATGEAYLRTGTGQPLVITTNAGSGIANERLRISSAGYVTKPNHPVFDVCGSTGNPNASSGSVYITYTTVKVNNGNHYSTSTGKFTVPVAGMYFFSFGCIKSGNSNLARLHLYKNGSSANDRHLRMPTGGDGYGENGAITYIVSLTASDYVQVYLSEGTVHADNDNYTYFNGYLIG